MGAGCGWGRRVRWFYAASLALAGVASLAPLRAAAPGARPEPTPATELLKDAPPSPSTSSARADPATRPTATAPAGDADGRERRLRQVEAQLRQLLENVEQLRAAGHAAAPATRPATAPATAPAEARPLDPVARIRDEGLNRSQVMQTASYLTDVIGPRLTGSPNLKRANEWTRDRLSSWGLADARLEAWGPFGRGWSLRRFSAQIVEPQAIPLIGYPRAWSPGLDAAATARVVHVDAASEADLAKYRGKLKGAIVLATADVREVQARFEPPAVRVTEANLLKLANAGPGRAQLQGLAQATSAAERRAAFASTPAGEALMSAGSRNGARGPGGAEAAGAETRPATGPTTRRGPTTRPRLSPGRLMSFLMDEGAAVVVTASTQGDGGTLFVGAATLPGRERQGSGGEDRPGEERTGEPRGPETRPADPPRVWATDAPATLPQVTLAAEDYNRLVRMIRHGVEPRMAVDLDVRFHHDDVMAYNTVAEIPGGDLKDEVVMLGAHLDSWHAGTGATDNAAGAAAVMEAVRILRALDLKPRRTIRVAFWTGEEQGLYGSKAYVARHFGSFAEPATQPAMQPAATQPSTGGTGRGPASRPARELIRRDGYERLSVYFNLDNGTGRVRGVYLQGNEAARPIFRQWLAPFEDLGASTITLASTGGTDHTPFDAIGLPGFQFIQDPIEYWSRTHHSNADVYDRLLADDLKQASVLLAAFAYNAAMADERFPRKPLDPPADRPGGRPPARSDGVTASGG